SHSIRLAPRALLPPLPTLGSRSEISLSTSFGRPASLPPSPPSPASPPPWPAEARSWSLRPLTPFSPSRPSVASLLSPPFLLLPRRPVSSLQPTASSAARAAAKIAEAGERL